MRNAKDLTCLRREAQAKRGTTIFLGCLSCIYFAVIPCVLSVYSGCCLFYVVSNGVKFLQVHNKTLKAKKKVLQHYQEQERLIEHDQEANVLSTVVGGSVCIARVNS